MATISWTSIKGHKCVLTISNGTNDVLTPAPDPFQTDGDRSSDFFQPIRSESGKINVLGDPSVLETLIGFNPLERPVTLRVDGNISWKGFLQGTSFDQDWTAGPNVIEIPVVSALKLIGSLRPSSDDIRFMTFAELLKKMNEALGEPYVYFCFPDRNNPGVTLGYKFDMHNYATFDDEAQVYNMDTFQDILEDICKFFGWQCQEEGNTLTFISMDVDTKCRVVDLIDLNTIISNGSCTLSDSPRSSTSAILPKIASNKHKISYNAGKRSVEVEHTANEYDATLWSLDTKNLGKPKSHETATRTYHGLGTLQTYQSYTFAGDKTITVQNTDHNPKFTTFKSGTGLMVSGSCITEEYLGCSNEDYGENAWAERVIMAGSVSFKVPIEHAKLTSRRYIFLKANVKSCHFGDDKFDTCDSATWSATIQYGNQVYIITEDGSYEWEELQEAESNNHVMRIYISDGTGTGNWKKDFRNDSEANNALIAIPYPDVDARVPEPSDLTITIARHTLDNKCYALERPEITFMYWNGDYTHVATDSNRVKHVIGTGFLDDYSISSKLTCFNDNPYGSGIIQSFDLASFPSHLGTSVRPEVDLADRLKTYFSTSRRMLEVEIELNQKLKYDVSAVYTDGTYNYALVSQSVDWHDDTIKAVFLELPPASESDD